MRHLSAAVLVTIIGVASIADAQTGWTGTVTTISTPVPTIGFLNPAIAVQPNGDAYAVWSDNVENDIQAARYVAATDSWDAPITLRGPGLLTWAEVAVDSAGNAFFVLANPIRSGSFILQIHVVRYSPSSGTTNTTTLSSTAQGFGNLVIDAAGNAMVGWKEPTGIHASRYDNASGTWAGPAKISAENVTQVRVWRSTVSMTSRRHGFESTMRQAAAESKLRDSTHRRSLGVP